DGGDDSAVGAETGCDLADVVQQGGGENRLGRLVAQPAFDVARDADRVAPVGSAHPLPELQLTVPEHRTDPLLAPARRALGPQRAEGPLGEVPEPHSRWAQRLSAQLNTRFKTLGSNSTTMRRAPIEYCRIRR